MTRFEAVALACLALIMVVAVLLRRSAIARGRTRNPGIFIGSDVSLFQLGHRHQDHQSQGQGHHHQDGAGHGSVAAGHAGVDAGHGATDAGHGTVDAGHAGIDGGGGGAH